MTPAGGSQRSFMFVSVKARDWLLLERPAAACLCQASFFGPPLTWGLGAERSSVLSTPQELPGGVERTNSASLSLTHTPISPPPTNTHYCRTKTHTLTSASPGLLPWVLPEPFVSTPPSPIPSLPSSPSTPPHVFLCPLSLEIAVLLTA